MLIFFMMSIIFFSGYVGYWVGYRKGLKQGYIAGKHQGRYEYDDQNH